MNTKHLFVAASITAIIIASLSAALLLPSQPTAIGEAVPATEAITTTTVQADISQTAKPDAHGWRSYESASFHVALRYPPDLTVQEFPESAGATSVIFRHKESGKGFQIYMTPYEDGAITKERFELDVPSGVMHDVTDVFVDGLRARSFYSTNPAMGGTYEVWVINDGFLYEVVTHDVFAPWLDSILQTWQFI